MNTLDDLRRTLDREAGGVHDSERYVRSVAVHERVRVVRRRRAATVAVAAAAVVATAVAGLSTLGGPAEIQAASHPVAGQQAPDRVAVHGFPYAFDQARTFEPGERTRLRLAKTDADRAVSLVGDGLGAGSATLYEGGEALARVRAGHDLEVPVPVSSSGTTLQIRLDGTPADAEVGLAVYTSTGAMAPGTATKDAVFREQVADDTLIGAAFSEPGESEASVTFTAAYNDVRFSTYCRSAEPGLWMHVAVEDQDQLIFGRCQDEDGRDPGASGASFAGSRVRDHTVRVYLTRGANGPEVTSEAATVGVGVYRRPADGRRVLGMRVDSTVEYAGRTWVLDRLVDQRAADGSVQATVGTADGDRLLGFVGRGDAVSASWTGRLDQGRSTGIIATESTASSLGGVLLAGDRYQVTLDSEDGSDVDGVLLVYRPV